MRNTVFSNKTLSFCYGCKACENICPHEAITMDCNEEGFVYPQIDVQKCVDCGLCEKVCPTQEKNIRTLFHDTPNEVYAMWNTQLEDRLVSTSGGAFFMFASKVISEGGVVYGVGYKSDLTAFHVKVTDIEGVRLLRGSKYMQSDINTTYKQVKVDLDRGLKVLFSGTPCQIAGLRLFLRKEYEDLVTIDLVCHGVPSPQIFKEHVKYLEKKYKDKLIDFRFRAKKLSGWRTYAKYIFETKSIYVLLGKDYYSHAFHCGHLSRESCYTCDFSRGTRVGDITLGDFWNSEKYFKELKRQRKYGFNMVMCNTNKGKKLFSSISADCEYIACPVHIAIVGDPRLRDMEEQRPSFRSDVYQICREKGYGYLAENYGLKLSLAQKIMPQWLKNVIREIQGYL